MNNYLLSTAYLAPVYYYSVLAQADKVILEQHDSYLKQSYRNRCRIAGANGVIDLSIPVEKPKSENKTSRDIRISDHLPWQKQHWRAIESAYNSSPFFEYYKDDFIPYYEKKWRFLWDFNQTIQNKVLDLLNLKITIALSSEYKRLTDSSVFDLREELHPKRDLDPALFATYYQVFGQKFGFLANLSIVDLVFNMGNESILILEENKILK